MLLRTAHALSAAALLLLAASGELTTTDSDVDRQLSGTTDHRDEGGGSNGGTGGSASGSLDSGSASGSIDGSENEAGFLPGGACECKETWTNEQCPDEQKGCPSKNCESEGEQPYCMVKNLACPESRGEGDWAFCGEKQKCKCKVTWTSNEDKGCEETQNGCPDTACDDDDETWCIVENPGCEEEVDTDEWFYCKSAPKTVAGAPAGMGLQVAVAASACGVALSA